MENEKLNQLQKMFEDGLITEDELKARREKVISEMINQDTVPNTNQSLETEKPKKKHKARKIILICIAVFLGLGFISAMFDDKEESPVNVEKMETDNKGNKGNSSVTEKKDSSKSNVTKEKSKKKADDITKYEAREIAEYVYGKENVVASWGFDTEKTPVEFNGKRTYIYYGYKSYCLVKVSESFYVIIYTVKIDDNVSSYIESIVEEISKDKAISIIKEIFEGNTKKDTYNKITIYSSPAKQPIYEYNNRFFYKASNFEKEIEDAHVEEKFDNFQKECEDFKMSSKLKELGF